MSKSRAVLIAVVMTGVAMLLAACFGNANVVGEELVIQTQSPPDPVYEPAGSPGLAAFFPLEQQLAQVRAKVDTEGADADASGGTAADDTNGSSSPIGLAGPSDDDVKSGLYGGTAENTCDPERLIAYLLDNPDKGQVWADVQGIEFVDIPQYIRSLTPTVLEVDTTVLNHGFDSRGHAIPIVSTLAKGTAVLVDGNGDVRTKCYCGNPILPYVPVTYQPPKCLTHFAVVYTSPSDRKPVADLAAPVDRKPVAGAADAGRIDTAPSPSAAGITVHATNRIATFDQVDWIEVSWNGAIGWVRADEAQPRYCKPADVWVCVDTAQVTLQPGTDRFVGEVTNAQVSVLAPDVEGWALIEFGAHSGWVEAGALNGQSCNTEVSCIATTAGTWTLPGEAGQQIVAAGNSQQVEYTGQSVVDPTGTYHQVFVTYPAPTRLGYVRDGDVSEVPETECETTIRCSRFDVDSIVYQESSGTDIYGALWFNEVEVTGTPVDGRYQIVWGGGPTGWVDVENLQGYGCVPTYECVVIYGPAYNSVPPGSGTVTAPTNTAIAVTFSGRIADNGTSTYKEVTWPGGTGWLETTTGYNQVSSTQCDEQPPCNVETQVCVVECSLEQVGEGWSVTASWSPASSGLIVEFGWPTPLSGTVPKGIYSSGITDGAVGSSLGGPVVVTWSDGAGQGGTVECEPPSCGAAGSTSQLSQTAAGETPVDVCAFECVLEYGSDHWTATAIWQPNTPLSVAFAWPSPLIGNPASVPLVGSGVSSKVVVSHPKQLTGPVVISWSDTTGQQGSTECEVDLCDVVGFTDGTPPYLGDVELPDTEACVSRLGCSAVSVQTAGVPLAEATVTWASNPLQALDLTFDWSNGDSEYVAAAQPPTAMSSQVSGTPTSVSIAWKTADGLQSGTLICDVEVDCAAQNPQLQLDPATGTCECPAPLVDDGNGGCTEEPKCADGLVEVGDGSCCAAQQVLNVTPSKCCPPNQEPAGLECAFKLFASPDQTPTPRPTPRPVATPTPRPVAPTPTPRPVCEHGIAPNGQCYRICARGELNQDGLCTCADGLVLRGRDGCVFECPVGQVEVSPGRCATTLRCEAGTLVGDRCEIEVAPVEGVGCPDASQQAPDCFESFARPTNQDCPRGTTPDAGGKCLRPVEVVSKLTCPEAFNLVGTRCMRYVAPIRG